MIDLDQDLLSSEHRELRAQLRRYVTSEIMTQAAVLEEAGTIPVSIFTRMGELGFLGLGMPEEYGGSNFDTLGSVVFGEELGRSGLGGFSSAISDHATSPLRSSGAAGPMRKRRVIFQI